MDLKKLGLRLLFPPVWLMVLLTIASAAALIAVFVSGWEMTVVAYITYVLAFYTLCTVTAYCVMVLPGQYKTIKQKIYSNPLGNRYMTDKVFRAEISLYTSLAINLLYAGLNVVMWYINRSWWFVVLAFYYAVLSIMRFLMVRYMRKNTIGSSMVGEWKRTRVCAAILLALNLSLSGAVLMILYQNRGYAYGGILIYVMAMFTFYSTTHAIIDIVKYRKVGSPVLSAAKVVSLSAALVSMLNLETAMFAQFGAEMSLQDQKLMIALTGAGISIVIIALSSLMIVAATKQIRREENGK